MNDAPALSTNTGLTVVQGTQQVISSIQLKSTDVDNSAAELTYSLVTAVTHGTLMKSGVPLLAGNSFNQADLDGAVITYTHDGSVSTSDSFVFTLSDGAGGMVGATTFDISVSVPTLNIRANGTLAAYPLERYGDQDLTPSLFTIADNQNSLLLQGNSWKRASMHYDVTENTVLEFDFQSSHEGEIHAIGFDTNNSVGTSDHFFQLHGTQAWWGHQDFNNYDPVAGQKHYVIRVGEFFTGNVSELVFANDDDADESAESTFSNMRVYESKLDVNINGTTSSYLLDSYGDQDLAPTSFAVEDIRSSLRLTGNTWKRVDVTFDVTASTVMEFDFQSNQEGEIQAIGLSTHNSLNSADHFFQLYGTQAWWGNQDFNNYDSVQGLRHYVVPLGEYFTGTFTRLVLVNDDDAGLLSESVFSNLRIYESSLDVDINGTTASKVLDSYGDQDLNPTAFAVEDIRTSLRLTGNTWKRLDVAFDVTANTVMEFDFQSEQEGEIQAIGLSTHNSLSSSDHFFQLYGTQAWWAHQDFNNYTSVQGLRHYVIPLGEYFTGTFTRLVFVNDDDAELLSESVFSNLHIYDSAMAGSVTGTTSSNSLDSGSNQVAAPAPHDIENDGFSLPPDDNSCGQVAVTDNRTWSTMLELDFRNRIRRAIHNVSSDTDNSLSTTDRFFQLYGTLQWWSRHRFSRWRPGL